MKVSRAILPEDAARTNFPEALHWLSYICCQGSPDTWLYSSPYSTPLRKAFPVHSEPRSPSITLPLDEPHQLIYIPRTQFYHVINLVAQKSASENCTVWEGALRPSSIDSPSDLGQSTVALKIVDGKALHQTALLRNEVKVYQELYSLQGSVMPRVMAYIRLWDIFDVLVLDTLGEPVTDWNPFTKQQARKLLLKIHDSGFLHGDVAPRNFIWTEKGLRVIDFGLSHPNANDTSKQHELLSVDQFE